MDEFFDMSCFPYNVWENGVHKGEKSIVVVSTHCPFTCFVFFDGILQYKIERPTREFREMLTNWMVPTKKEFLANRKRWDNKTYD